MKKLTVFETSIIGFFIGVVAATYIVFLESTAGFVGKILGWLSLLPVLDTFTFPPDKVLFVYFLFILALYTLYGAIVGFIIKGGKIVTIFVIAIILLLPVAIFFEQRIGSVEVSKLKQSEEEATAMVFSAVPKIPSQYFGDEVFGDLNSDGRNDVAFIMDEFSEDGLVHYVATALKSDNGYIGTNLIYLGDKIEPNKINIENGLIVIDYVDFSIKNATSTNQMFAQVLNGKLIKIETVIKDEVLRVEQE